jgi:multiple sugar transport system substrate-binding protein
MANSDSIKLSRRGFLGGSAAAIGGLAFSSATRAWAAGGGFSIANWSDAPAVSQLYFDIMDNYQKATGVKINRQANVSFADYNTRFRVLLAGGSPPDVMRLNDDFLREMSDKKQILDLTALIKSSDLKMEDYFPDVFNFTQTPGGHTGMTIGVSPRVMYYNKTAFQKAGIPLPPKTWTKEGWTWDDFLNAAKALTRGTEQYGVQITLDTALEQMWPVNNGGEGIFSKDGRSFTLSEGPNVEAIQYVADLALVHKVAAPWADVQATNATFDRFTNQQDLMRSGPMSDYSYFQGAIKDFEWDVAPQPGKVAQMQNGGNTLFVIPTKAKHPEDAFKFLEYLTGPEGGKLFAANAAFIPVNKDAAKTIGAAGNVATGNMQLFVEAAANQTNTNSTIATSQAVAVYRPQLQLVYAGSMTAKQALADAKSQIDPMLQG